MKSQIKFDELSSIIAFEQGDLTQEDTIILFQHLVDNGHAWSLQGMYGRTAAHLIQAGYVTDTHHVLAERKWGQA